MRPPAEVAPAPLAITVWWSAFGDGDQWGGDLMPDERHRAAGLVSPGARAQYIAGRRLLRGVLARHLAVAPDALRFGRGVHGKPFLTGVRQPVRFSLSHVHDLAVVALSAGAAVGVDVERYRRIEAMAGISQRWLSPREQACIAAAGEAGPAMFLRIWTMKEASLKAWGLGLAALADIEVCPRRRRARMRSEARWSLACTEFAVMPDVIGACAVRSARPLVLTVKQHP